MNDDVEVYGEPEGFEKLENLSDDELRDMTIMYVNSATTYQLMQLLGLCRELFFEWEAE